ncbi:hypothetical protein BDY21DRAFT_160107 [Lineolata rhizophorae]|uniref:Peptidase M20 dimerisation domain-containing protein n=1 Tax=Lineolata rhizophorae TaxID=578093 RepID=A0A6A6P8Z4_9PEZI|nr:hypothetical protein BDY21DRAFT_160107 [Lineolata rhizophorae]
MSRLALSDADKEARDWFIETAKARNCSTTVDAMGNIFAVRPGRRQGPPTFAGSHLDTQPAGGRYDGILGVTSGIEMIQVLDDHWVETEFPVGVVNWTNEEGARFPISMLASGVWAGEIPLSHAHELREVGHGNAGATVASELARIGYLGSTPCSHEATPMAAHFELHIEQGPTLESTSRKVGIVHGAQAYRWFTIEVTGRAAHTGATSFAHRADALLAAARMVSYARAAAEKHGALASTGIMNVEPGSTNTVPGHVKFSLDVRAAKDHIVDAVEEELRNAFSAIAKGEMPSGVGMMQDAEKGKPCIVEWTTDSNSPAIDFHEDCISCVRKSAEATVGDETDLTMDMRSGAGHDSVYASRQCPTSMIFVPCKDGVSHNPEEYTAPEDCAIGAQVLLGAVLRFDRLRARRGW